MGEWVWKCSVYWGKGVWYGGVGMIMGGYRGSDYMEEDMRRGLKLGGGYGIKWV